MNVKKWRKTERDSLDNALLLVEEEFYVEALPMFEELLNHHPDEGFLKYSFAKCAIYRADKHDKAYEYITEIFPKNKSVPEIKYEYAKAAHYNNKFDEAKLYVNQCKRKQLTPEQWTDAENLRRYLQNSRQYYITPTAAKVNIMNDLCTSEDEYCPLITLDESCMVMNYCGKKSTGGMQGTFLRSDIPYARYLDDIVISRTENGAFNGYQGVDSINTFGRDQVIGMSPDGKIIFVYQDIEDTHGDIFECHLMGNYYSAPKKLKGAINGYSKDSYCSLSPDGKTMYFSSNRPGGKGGMDIYKASLGEDSTWVNVVNLGDSINTPFDDDMPFMHADGMTLFFSSNGRNSMGDYDIFWARRRRQDSTFAEAQNLGFPINTTEDDLHLVLTADGSHGYYSSARPTGKGMSDVYHVEPFLNWKPAVMLVRGSVKVDNKPYTTLVRFTYARTGENYATVSSAGNGSFMVAVPIGQKYVMTVAPVGFPSKSYTIDATVPGGYTERIMDVKFETKTEPVATKGGKDGGKSSTTSASQKTVSATSVATKTTSSTSTTTVAATKTTSAVSEPTTAPVSTNTAAVASNTPPVNTNTTAVPSTSSEPPAFTAHNKVQEKSMKFAAKYGNFSAPGLEYRIQISATKGKADAKAFPKLARLGKIEVMDYGDGFNRITAGGSFKTLNAALKFNGKIVEEGSQPDAFVIVVYNSKHSSFEELEQQGVYK